MVDDDDAAAGRTDGVVGPDLDGLLATGPASEDTIAANEGRVRRTLDYATTAVQVYGLTDFHAKNAMALARLKTEFKGRVEVLPLPVPVLRALKKFAAEVLREESEKTPMARKVHASFTKFQALVGPWDHVAEGAYHQFVAT